MTTDAVVFRWSVKYQTSLNSERFTNRSHHNVSRALVGFFSGCCRVCTADTCVVLRMSWFCCFCLRCCSCARSSRSRSSSIRDICMQLAGESDFDLLVHVQVAQALPGRVNFHSKTTKSRTNRSPIVRKFVLLGMSVAFGLF